MTQGERLGLVVLAGGTSRRWGGADKTALRLAGRPVLLHCLDALTVLRGLDPSAPGVMVAPPEHPDRSLVDAAHDGVRWVREDPPGGGPAAGLATGLAVVDGGGEIVVALAGDLPFGAAAVPRLLDALRGDAALDAALAVDPDGRWQPLLAAYRVQPLRRALGTDVRNASLKPALSQLRIAQVAVSAVEALDLDTPEDFARAEDVLRDRRTR